MSQSQHVTICIPTKNRCDFLKRAMAYYIHIGFQGFIFIADGSDPQKLEENKANIKQYQKQLNVEHFDCTGKSILSSVDYVNQFLKTPYAAVCSDDDFLCLQGIEDAVDFMNQHSDYSACHGLGAIFGLEDSGPYGAVNAILPYPQARLDASSGMLRLTQYFEHGPSALVYSIHRSADWKEMWREYPNAKSCFIFDELVPSSYSAIRGKIGQLDSLYLVRQMHDGIYKQTPFFDWITHPLWHSNFEYFRTMVIRDLIAVDHISREEAERFFKEMFQAYLTKTFNNFIAKQQNTNSKIKERIKKVVPFVSETYAFLKKSGFTNSKEQIGFDMLKSHSPHFDAFKKIRESVEQKI